MHRRPGNQVDLSGVRSFQYTLYMFWLHVCWLRCFKLYFCIFDAVGIECRDNLEYHAETNPAYS